MSYTTIKKKVLKILSRIAFSDHTSNIFFFFFWESIIPLARMLDQGTRKLESLSFTLQLSQK